MRAWSGPNIFRIVFCDTEGCVKDGESVEVFAVKHSSGLLMFSEMYCPSCLQPVSFGQMQRTY